RSAGPGTAVPVVCHETTVSGLVFTDRAGRVEGLDSFGIELELARGKRLAQLLHRVGPDDRRGYGRACQQPGQGYLCRGGVMHRSDLIDLVQQRKAPLVQVPPLDALGPPGPR